MPHIYPSQLPVRPPRNPVTLPVLWFESCGPVELERFPKVRNWIPKDYGIRKWDRVADSERPILPGHRVETLIVFCEHVPYFRMGIHNISARARTLRLAHLLYVVFRASVQAIIEVLQGHDALQEAFRRLVKEKKGIEVLEDIWRLEWDFVATNGEDWKHTMVLEFEQFWDYSQAGSLLKMKTVEELMNRRPKYKRTFCFTFEKGKLKKDLFGFTHEVPVPDYASGSGFRQALLDWPEFPFYIAIDCDEPVTRKHVHQVLEYPIRKYQGHFSPRDAELLASFSGMTSLWKGSLRDLEWTLGNRDILILTTRQLSTETYRGTRS